MGTQLLVIQHLRQHLPAAATRDFLIWHPLANNGQVQRLMREIISTAGFAGVLDMQDFQSLRPRTEGPIAWLFESPRRLRADAARIHAWMAANDLAEEELELWTDDPIHFSVIFPNVLLRRARHVKIPHCFNHEDAANLEWKTDVLERQWREQSWAKRRLFAPWQRWTTGIDFRMETVSYDRAYSFDLPSTWARHSVDASNLITLDAFAATYATLPDRLRREVEESLAQIRSARRPLMLLLLFGLGPGPGPRFQPAYLAALKRILAERPELRQGTLAVKMHPGGTGVEEAIFMRELEQELRLPVLPILHGLNLEFMLPQLRPDYVMAGPCGALPVVGRMKSGRAIALREMVDLFRVSGIEFNFDVFLRDIEIW